MLQLIIPKTEESELWDEFEERFITMPGFKGQTLQLEHSLVSLYKWESKWNKPFLSRENKTYEETVDYIKCMTITQNVRPEAYDYLTTENIDKVNKYISAPMTATILPEDNSKKGSREVVTAELIYYWMIALQIPSEYRKWHLNQLLTLIQVCNIKNTPPKKRSRREIMSRNAALNAARKKQFNTTG